MLQAVLAANDPAAGFEVVIVRPPFIWGPGDTVLLPALLKAMQARSFK
jgi:hypothetical protein